MNWFILTVDVVALAAVDILVNGAIIDVFDLLDRLRFGSELCRLMHVCVSSYKIV